MGEPVSSISPRKTMPVTMPILLEYTRTGEISYERALRNLTVLMFSHLCIPAGELPDPSRAIKTFIVHECLQVAAALGRYHCWQCRVNLQEISSKNADWNKIPTVAKGNYRFKYSPGTHAPG